MPDPLLIAPTEEAWRTMTPGERQRFLIMVNDALPQRHLSMEEGRFPLRVAERYEAKIGQIKARIENARIEQARAEVEQAEAKAERAEAKIQQAIASSRENVLAFLAARQLPLTDEIRTTVMTCDDLELLQRWLSRTLSAASIQDVFRQP